MTWPIADGDKGVHTFLKGIRLKMNISFRSTWICLIIKIHATREKFHLPSSYCSVINCPFTFCSANVSVVSATLLFDFVCLGYMAYQHLLATQCQIHFYANEQFYFKQFSLAYIHSLIVKTFLFQTIQFNLNTQFNCQKHFYFNL